MSEREVPRRESPWGRPEGDTRQPKAHRCNDRVEDVVQPKDKGLHAPIGLVLTADDKTDLEFDANLGNPFKTVPGPFKLFWQCMQSKPGEEPTEPFYYLQLPPPTREVKLE